MMLITTYELLRADEPHIAYKHSLRLDILRFLSEGFSQKEISERLNIPINSIENHVLGMRLTLSAKNTAHLIAIALRKGIIK